MEELLQERAADHRDGAGKTRSEGLNSGVSFENAGKRFRGRRGPWSPFARRHDIDALCAITVDCPAGSSLAVVGPNGSGKTTLLRLAAGLLSPTSGHVRVPPRIVYVPGTDRQFYDRLTGWENLQFFARMAGVDAAPWREAAGVLGLRDAIDEPLWTYSSGMRVRLALARAYAARDSAIILDEPTRALDTAGREAVSRVMATQVRAGAPVLVATHDIELAAGCDRAIVLARGTASWSGLVQDRRRLAAALDDAARLTTASDESGQGTNLAMNPGPGSPRNTSGEHR